MIKQAMDDPSWLSIARLDAAVRFVESMRSAGGLKPGPEAERFLRKLLKPDATIPDGFWSVLPAPTDPEQEDECLIFRGAVLVRVLGRRLATPLSETEIHAPMHVLSPELSAALAEPAAPTRKIVSEVLRGEGKLALVVIACGIVITAFGVVLESLMLRGLIDIGRQLRITEQRLGAIGVFLLFLVFLTAVEWFIAGRLMRLGRRLEAGLRMRFLEVIPRLHDRYFSSRPTSDMVDRCHGLFQIRVLPRLCSYFARSALILLVTALAVSWSDPLAAPLAIAAALFAIALPMLILPWMQQLDLRAQTHAGGLSMFYLDSLRGLTASRAHGRSAQALLNRHEELLVEWVRSSRLLLKWGLLLEGVQSFVGFSLACWLLYVHTTHVAEPVGALLLAYWALNFPVLGGEIALLARQYPLQRNKLLRLLDPLSAPVNERSEQWEELSDSVQAAPGETVSKGVSLDFESLGVKAAGQTILQGINAIIPAGCQLAIVGPSGAGKSSLAGVLLGWHRPAEGRVLVDGKTLDETSVEILRQETAWLDPEVRLWNRSLLSNLLYGTEPGEFTDMAEVLAAADLLGVVQHLPDGLQCSLGEGGGQLSGGEGQRVRFGRALLRRDARLVILDEPFRGLDRTQRNRLLTWARNYWRGATLLCISHDLEETLEFERVLVIESGLLVEDGNPVTLSTEPESVYAKLLSAERSARSDLWSSPVWQRLVLTDGHLAASASTGDSGHEA